MLQRRHAFDVLDITQWTVQTHCGNCGEIAIALCPFQITMHGATTIEHGLISRVELLVILAFIRQERAGKNIRIRAPLPICEMCREHQLSRRQFAGCQTQVDKIDLEVVMAFRPAYKPTKRRVADNETILMAEIRICLENQCKNR
ncbi:hypothetical protein ATY77_00975 [Rhizobium sp. R634]|nr:hypothetical protein ATY77_00975 [Rhizobium sp. R634]